MTTCSVLIADSNTRLSQLVGQLLADEPGFRVLGVHAEAEAVMRAAAERRPDVVLMSDRIEGQPVAPLCEQLRQVAPAAALAMWTHDPVSRGEAQAVADAVVERGTTFRELVSHLRVIAGRGAVPGPAAAPEPPVVGTPDAVPPRAVASSRTVLDHPESTGLLLLNCDSCAVQVRLATDDIAPAVEEAREFFAEHAACTTGIDLTERLRQRAS